MEKQLAIFDTDILYTSRLMEYFKKTKWDEFEILLFTKKDSLINFLKYQAIDILLYGGDTSTDEFPKDNIRYVFRLCEDTNQIQGRDEMIYKYQPACKLGADILSRYTRLEDINQNGSDGDVRFVAFFAPVPGEDKITYTWSAAKKLSNNSKVLFIDLEQLPAAAMLRQEDSGRSMSELLYYLKEAGSNYIDKLKSYLNYSEKLSYLTGPTHGFDLLSLSREDMGRLMDDIKNHTDYETVILHLGIYTEASMEALSRSDEVNIISCDLPYEESAVKEWERQMGLIGKDNKNLKINRIIL